MRFTDHKYTWHKPFGSVRHAWSLRGPMGGIEFNANVVEKYGDTCGLEFHRSALCGLWKAGVAMHKDCHVIGGNCWHDGTSLYASETLWPMIKPLVRIGDHDAVLRLLEREYDEHFARFGDEPGAADEAA